MSLLYVLMFIVSRLYTARKMHIKARGPSYPETTTKKFPIPDEMVDWHVQFDDYKPVNYTSEKVLKKPAWADPDLRYTTLYCPLLYTIVSLSLYDEGSIFTISGVIKGIQCYDCFRSQKSHWNQQ